MKIELKRIKIRDVVKNYENKLDEGVIGYSGTLNIRPTYQREFIYKDQQRDEVIRTVRKSFPLNIMYWAKNDDDATFEVLDGQQRTISVCDYVSGVYSVDFQYFHNLSEEEQEHILDYELMVFVCEGSTREKLDWFRIINIAGEKLTDQELRNAVYTGAWLSDAKRYFSKNKCPAYGIGSGYVKGSPIRQDYLETALDWISGGNIEDYMSKHQHNGDGSELWLYFNSVITWTKAIFTTYRKDIKGVNLGILHKEFGDKEIDTDKLELRISELMMDDEVTKKKGIFTYVLDGDERWLNIRAFTKSQISTVFERQGGVCPICDKVFELSEMEADHVVPWSKGGKTSIENCQMLCRADNRKKSGK